MIRAICCPEGAIGLSPGFQPHKVSTLGTIQNKWFALTGREMRTRFTCVVARFNLPPLQGAPPWTGVPGLKPRARPEQALARRRAEPSPPFGVKKHAKFPLT